MFTYQVKAFRSHRIILITFRVNKTPGLPRPAMATRIRYMHSVLDSPPSSTMSFTTSLTLRRLAHEISSNRINRRRHALRKHVAHQISHPPSGLLPLVTMNFWPTNSANQK